MKQEYSKPMCRIIGTEWSGALLAFKVPGNYVTSVRISSRNGLVL